MVADSVAAIYGFEITARLESGPNNQPAGNFVAGPNQKVVCSDNKVEPDSGCGGSGLQWLEHSQPSLADAISIQWTPPSAGSGNVHFYVSANAANGDNSRLGDHIYAADYVLTPAMIPTANAPKVTAIMNAASGLPGAESGSWVTITGSNFAASATPWDNAIVNNVYPTTLGGVTVAIDGKPAPISFVSQTQITAIVPATNKLGNVNVVVSSGEGSSAPFTLALVPSSPGLFAFTPQQGKYAAAVVLDSGANYEFLAPPGLLGDLAQCRAAKAGDTISLYGTAFGATTTPLNPEIAASVAYPLAHSGPDITLPLAQVTVGGQPAQLRFAGIVAPGVYQINVIVPQGLSSGDQQVTVSLLNGSTVSQSLVIPIQ